MKVTATLAGCVTLIATFVFFALLYPFCLDRAADILRIYWPQIPNFTFGQWIVIYLAWKGIWNGIKLSTGSKSE